MSCWALGIACALPLAGPPAFASENLLANPDFETPVPEHAWMPTGWDTTGAGLTSVFFGRDTVLAHSGRHSISVANASAVWAIEHGWSQSLVVEPSQWGKDFVLTLWTRSIGVEGRASVVLQAMRDTIGETALRLKISREEAESRIQFARIDDRALAVGWQRVVFREPETEWVKRELRLHVAPTTNVVTVRVAMLGVGQIYVDDASLTLEPALPAQEPAPGVNLIADPSFEGDLTSWEISHPPFPGIKGEQQGEVVHSGEKAIRFSGDGGLVRGRAGMGQVICNRALSGKRLRLVGYAKADSLLSNGFCRIYCNTASGQVIDTSIIPVSGTTDWTKLSVEIDAPADTYAVWAWLAYTAPSKGLIYFDDLSLEVVGPAGRKTAAGAKP